MGSKVDLKCVLLGKAAVGKSCLVERFLHDRWSTDHMPTVGAAFGAREMQTPSGSVMLGVWDTAGSERYESMTKHYYKGAEAAVVCFDLTDQESWEKVKFWVEQLLAVEDSVILAIVGCKADTIGKPKPRAVDPSVVRNYAHELNATAYETSALTGANVSQPFMDICKQFIAKGGVPASRKSKGKGKNINISGGGGKGGGGCCK